MKTSCGKFLNLAHYFPYDVKLRPLARNGSFLANQKARNAIVGAENFLTDDGARSAEVAHQRQLSPIVFFQIYRPMPNLVRREQD